MTGSASVACRLVRKSMGRAWVTALEMVLATLAR